MSHLLLVYHVGFGKNGAASGDADGVTAFHGFFGKFLDADAQPQCLVVKETAGTGSAYGVHAEIGDYSVADNNDFTVLPADFEYRPDIGEEVGGGDGMGGYLIFNDISPDDLSRQIPGAASRAGAGDLI